LNPEAYSRRLQVIPGLSGPWQISGRSELSYEDMIKLDLEYVENWSLAQDLWIICRTFLVVLRRRGAYCARGIIISPYGVLLPPRSVRSLRLIRQSYKPQL